ncbi:MAG TPA: TolC family protein [Ignavibacteria bacterium]|nr:TolC family protein [Ignavibacteria bacterium]
MKTNIIIIIIVSLLSLTDKAYSQNSLTGNLTLQKAIRLTLKNQPLIKQAEDEVEAAEAKIKFQKSFYYPDIEANLSYSRIGPVPTIEFGKLSLNLFPANNYDAYVGAMYNIFDFGKKKALLNLTKTFKLTASEKINFIKYNLSYETVKLFYTILFVEKSLDVKNQQINTLNSHLEITQKKVESGTATDFDVLTTKVRVASAENGKADIENSINKEKIALKSLMGLSSNTPLKIQGNLSLIKQSINLDSLMALAFNQREEIKMALDANNSLKMQKQVASLSDMPTLNALVNYGLKNGYMPNLNALRGNWIVGISANIPIFNGNRKEAQVQEVQANLNANNEQIATLKRKIKIEVEQAISELKTSRSQLSTAKLQVEQAKQALRRARSSYKNGVITNLDLLDAETSLAEAQFSHLRVIYQNVINTYSLREAVGDVLN